MKNKILMICTIAMAMMSFGTMAQQAPQQQGDQGGQQNQQGNRHGPRKACRADVEKFCPGVKPGEGRIIACLESNSSKLSQECAAMVAKAANRQGQGQGQGQGKGQEQDEDGGEQ